MRAELSHRERVLRAIGHQEVDRTPCFFAAEEDVEARLRQEFGLAELVDIIRFFGGDTIQVTLNVALPDLSGVEAPEDLELLPWPGPETVDLAGYMGRLRAARETGLAVLGGVWATIFTGPRRAMGEPEFLMAMLDRPGLIARIVEKAADCYLGINQAIFSTCADSLDVFYFGSDFGTQRALFISREAFLRFFRPHLTRLARQAKGYGLKVMFHTCGAVSEIIPDLVACGIDVLDPVQVSASSMEPARLAREYLGKLAFHGGISTQTLLPRATPAQVRAAVRETILALAPSGYICGPDQWMMADVPTENMMAMYEAIRTYGRQPG